MKKAFAILAAALMLLAAPVMSQPDVTVVAGHEGGEGTFGGGA